MKLMNKRILITGTLIVIVAVVFACLPKANQADKTAATATAEKAATRSAGEAGIKFIEANWSKALAEAKKQNKLIFLDAYTTWCGPCRMLKNNTFPDKAAGEFFNKHFVNIALDMEKGDGVALGTKFGVDAYPTLIFADSDGNMVTFTQGYMEPKQLIEFGKYGLSKIKKP